MARISIGPWYHYRRLDVSSNSVPHPPRQGLRRIHDAVICKDLPQIYGSILCWNTTACIQPDSSLQEVHDDAQNIRSASVDPLWSPLLAMHLRSLHPTLMECRYRAQSGPTGRTCDFFLFVVGIFLLVSEYHKSTALSSRLHCAPFLSVCFVTAFGTKFYLILSGAIAGFTLVVVAAAVDGWVCWMNG